MSTGMPWVRLHTDFINDEKLGALTRSAKLRFFELLALAGQLNAGGSIASGGAALSVAQIAFKLHDSREAVDADMAELAACGVIAFADGAYSITNWDKRQSEKWEKRRADCNARVQKHRAAKAEKFDNNADVTQKQPCNADVTALQGQCNAVTEAQEIEVEKEIEELSTKLEVSCTAQAAQKTTTDQQTFVPPPSVSAKSPPSFTPSATQAIFGDELPQGLKAQKTVREVKAEARAAQNAVRPRYLDYPAVAAVARGWDKFFTASFAEWLHASLAYPLQEGRVTSELLETRAKEWAAKYGTYQRENQNLIAVLLNGWDERKEPTAAKFFNKPVRVGRGVQRRPQVQYADDSERAKAAERNAAREIEEREARRIQSQRDAENLKLTTRAATFSPSSFALQPSALAAWDSVKEAIERETGRGNFITFLKAAQLVAVDGDRALVFCPNKYGADWLANRSADRLAALWQTHTGASIHFTFAVKQQEAAHV